MSIRLILAKNQNKATRDIDFFSFFCYIHWSSKPGGQKTRRENMSESITIVAMTVSVLWVVLYLLWWRPKQKANKKLRARTRRLPFGVARTPCPTCQSHDLDYHELADGIPGGRMTLEVRCKQCHSVRTPN